MLDRLLSLKHESESDAAFARRLGLQPQHLSNYRSGRHTLSLRTAIRVARAMDLSLDWLLLGRGEPFRESSDVAETAHPLPEEMEELSNVFLEKVEGVAEEGLVAEETAERIRASMEELQTSLEELRELTAS